MEQKKYWKLVILWLLFIILVPYSYARFGMNTSSVYQLDVAKWQVLINDQVNLDGELIDLDLFQTTDGGLDATKQIIAPGSSGNFELVILNDSEVTSEYTILFEEENLSNIPIEYSLTGLEDSWVSLNELDISKKEIEQKKEDVVTIYWRWAYYQDEQQNTLDNSLGIDGVASVKLQLKVYVEQKIN